VTRALAERAAHPVYGYTLYPDSVYEAVIGWLKAATAGKSSATGSHGPRRGALAPCRRAWPSPQPGEGVIVQPPVYFPFFSSVTTPGRRLIENPLREKDGTSPSTSNIWSTAPPDAMPAADVLAAQPGRARVVARRTAPGPAAIARRHDLVVLPTKSTTT
jgi:cystathionine beta-lyase